MNLWRLWTAFFIVLMAGINARGDEAFLKRLAQFENRTTSAKTADCGTDGCNCSPCKSKPKAAPAKFIPPLSYKHTCGCQYAGGPGCNCAVLGGCHCAENTRFNRVNPEWSRQDDGTWVLWRGQQFAGAIDGDGLYRPWLGTDYGPPAKAPIPMPREQSSVPKQQQVQVCRT